MYVAYNKRHIRLKSFVGIISWRLIMHPSRARTEKVLRQNELEKHVTQENN